MAKPWLTPVRPGAQQTPGRPPSDVSLMISVASELLRALDAAPDVAQRQFRDQLAQLATLFPDATEDYLEDILSKVDGDLERAVTVMLTPNSPFHKKAPAPPAAIERPLAPDFSYPPGGPWQPAGTPSGPPATSAAPQPSPRAQALAVVIAAPSQPEREDTPMEDAAAAPDLVAPAPEDPEPTPGSPVDPWAPTQDDENAQRDTLYLRQIYPAMSDEFCLRAVEEGNGDPAATIAWAATLSDADRVLGVIADAFPTATPEEVKDTLLAKGGNAAAAYALLSRLHVSTWDRGHSSLHSQLTGKLLPATDNMTPEFRDQSPSYAHHETKWWDTMVATKAYKVAGSPQDLAAWSHVSLLATSMVDITLQVAGFVESLSAWYADRSSFQEAMKQLQTFSGFGALTRFCATNPEQRESALSIVLALMEDGLASPGAAAWAMQMLTRSTQAYNTGRFYFSAYGANRRILWNQRNQALAAWKATRDLAAGSATDAPPGDTDECPAAPPGPPADPRVATQEAASAAASEAKSAATTLKSAHPRSLPGTSGWALPMSSSTAKYADMTAGPKRAQSASASKASRPPEGLSDPSATRPVRLAVTKSRNRAAEEKAEELARKGKGKMTGKN